MSDGKQFKDLVGTSTISDAATFVVDNGETELNTISFENLKTNKLAPLFATKKELNNYLDKTVDSTVSGKLTLTKSLKLNFGATSNNDIQITSGKSLQLTSSNNYNLGTLTMSTNDTIYADKCITSKEPDASKDDNTLVTASWVNGKHFLDEGQKNAANGIAPLNANKKVPLENLQDNIITTDNIIQNIPMATTTTIGGFKFEFDEANAELNIITE